MYFDHSFPSEYENTKPTDHQKQHCYRLTLANNYNNKPNNVVNSTQEKKKTLNSYNKVNGSENKPFYADIVSNLFISTA